MSTMDIILFGVVATIIIVAGIMYLVKKGSAKKSIKEAEEAMLKGDDSLALMNLNSALIDADETPDLELEILDKIENLYRKNQITFDFSNYRKLIENSRILLRKTSKKSEKEFSEIDDLKQKIRNSMPPIKKGDAFDQMKEMSKNVSEEVMKKLKLK